MNARTLTEAQLDAALRGEARGPAGAGKRGAKRVHPHMPFSALEAIREGAELLQTAKGQGYADPVRRAHDALSDVIAAADQVVRANELYYHQSVDASDAQHLALSALSDRIDDLRAAIVRAEGEGA